MKTIRISLYSLSELSEQARAKALSSLAHINVEHKWWDFTYEDALSIGVKIKSFDLDSGQIETEHEWNESDTALEILKDHGSQCLTSHCALGYLRTLAQIATSTLSEEKREEALDEAKEAFAAELKDAYLKMLREEYDYLISEEAVAESIESNEYEFLSDGTLFHRPADSEDVREDEDVPKPEQMPDLPAFYCDGIQPWTSMEVEAMVNAHDTVTGKTNLRIAEKGEKPLFHSLYLRGVDGSANCIADVPTSVQAATLRLLIHNAIDKYHSGTKARS